MSTISTHVLDTSLGKPAAGIRVMLERTDGAVPIAVGDTDSNGRIAAVGDASIVIGAGTYRLRFETSEYFARTQRPVFFPEVSITFTIIAVLAAEMMK